MPKASDRIIYVQGSFDLLHHGHLKRLQLAKQEGDFMYVGIWDDQMVKYYRGDCYPVQSIQERVLQVLSSKYADDVVIGAPFILTKDLITSLNIKKVVTFSDSEEDNVKPEFSESDQFSIAREMGILTTLKVNDPFFDITTEKIALRVLQNMQEY
jgi:ethanolamine-phosphate cytidylyltransferase